MKKLLIACFKRFMLIKEVIKWHGFITDISGKTILFYNSLFKFLMMTTRFNNLNGRDESMEENYFYSSANTITSALSVDDDLDEDDDDDDVDVDEDLDVDADDDDLDDDDLDDVDDVDEDDDIVADEEPVIGAEDLEDDLTLDDDDDEDEDEDDDLV